MASSKDARLEKALQYAARGWKVFLVSKSKKPFAGSHGFKDATADPAEIRAMFERHPGGQLALATGFIVIFDADGAEGLAAFLALGKGPRTLVARTPRGGLHFYYLAPNGLHIRSKASPRAVKGGPGIDIRAYGGFALLPPSAGYTWALEHPIADLPPHLIEYAQSVGAKREPRPQIEVPAYLAEAALGLTRLCDRATAGMELEWNAHEYARVWSALKSIGNKCGYDDFLKTGFALHDLNWVRSDGSNVGFELWDQWAAQFPDSYNLHGLETKWASFGRSNYDEPHIRINSLFKMAHEHGWDGTVELPPPRPQIEGPGAETHPEASTGPFVNGHLFEPAGLPPDFLASAIIFPDTDAKGKPKGTCANARVAIRGLSIDCRKDTFHEKMLVGGHAIQAWGDNLSDEVVHMMRKICYDRFEFDAGERNTRDAAIQLCLERQFNPVVEYLASLKWDGRRRIERWTVDYLGATDTRLNREFGRLMLIAAVRRARAPGTKFDQIVVLEGKEGTGKSSAVKILAGEENFSDQHIMGASDKEQQEAFTGVWLHEIAELAGMRRADVEKIKQFASRTEDRARPAYGRIRVDMKRRGIFIATTNESSYLKSETGNRRFWPIDTRYITLKQIAEDRDLLWAEAALAESKGESIELSEALRREAAEQQEGRREGDVWENIIDDIVNKENASIGDISIVEILRGPPFHVPERDIGQVEQNRVARVLQRKGFERYRASDAGRTWRYRRKWELGQEWGIK